MTQNQVWQFSVASQVRFGRGCISSLVTEMRNAKMTRVLVVTDRVIKNIPAVADALAEVEQSFSKVAIFEECEAEPSIAVAESAISLGRGAEVDGVLGIGGGSCMDVAKMASVVLRHGGAPRDYLGFDRVPGRILPVMAVPTTAGTGSEVSHSSVLTDTVARVKVSTLSRWLRPWLALVDPSLTDSCPATVTAHSGMDALVHAIEALTNRPYSDLRAGDFQAYSGSFGLTRVIACEAIRLIGSYLQRAVSNGADVEARDGMAEAALLAGMAFSNSGVGLVHALEYPIGALTHCSHGEGNALLLPHVMRFNLSQCVERMAWITDALGLKVGSDPELKAKAAIDAIVRLQKEVGIRTRLRELGLEDTQIPFVAEQAVQIKRLMDINPRLPTEKDLCEILKQAF